MAQMLGEPGFAAEEPIRERFKLATGLIDAPPKDETSDLYPGMTAFHAFYTATRVQHEVNEGLLPDDMFDDDGVAQPGTQAIAELKIAELLVDELELVNRGDVGAEKGQRSAVPPVRRLAHHRFAPDRFLALWERVWRLWALGNACHRGEQGVSAAASSLSHIECSSDCGRLAFLSLALGVRL